MKKINDHNKAKKPVLGVLRKRRGRKAMECHGRREGKQVRRDCELPPLKGYGGVGK